MTDGSDPFGKLRWSLQHLERLATIANEWAGKREYSITQEPDLNDPGNTAFYVDQVVPPPADLPFLIGDFLQALRNSLDHLAFALASAHSGPLPDEVAQSSEFPIFGDKDRKGRAGTGATRFASLDPGGGRHKIRGVSPEAQAIIEALQPYHGGNDYSDHPLWRLHVLSVIDKHEATTVLEVAFDPATPLVGGEEVILTLGRLYTYVAQKVVPPLRPLL